jgi:hypothetical protein
MNAICKLFALAIVVLIPATAANDPKARDSYHKELRNQRHAAALAQSREHRNHARALNKERKAYAKELRHAHPK